MEVYMNQYVNQPNGVPPCRQVCAATYGYRERRGLRLCGLIIGHLIC